MESSLFTNGCIPASNELVNLRTLETYVTLSLYIATSLYTNSFALYSLLYTNVAFLCSSIELETVDQ